MVSNAEAEEYETAYRSASLAAEVPAHHAGVLALDEGVVVGAPGARLGELADVQLVQQRGDAVVDVLGAGASLRDALSAWKPSTRNGNMASSASEQRNHEPLGDARQAPTCSY